MSTLSTQSPEMKKQRDASVQHVKKVYSRPRSPVKRASPKNQKAKAELEMSQDMMMYGELSEHLSDHRLENERLKTVIQALEQKLNAKEAVVAELNKTRQLLQKSEEDRNELQVHISETIEQMKQHQGKNEAYQGSLLSENQRLNGVIESLRSDLLKSEHDKRRVQNDLHCCQQSVLQKNLEIEALKSDGKLADRAFHENLEAQQARAQHSRKYDKMVQEFQVRLKREREQRDNLTQEVMKLNVQMRATERELTEFKNRTRKLELDLIAKDDSIYSLNEQIRNKDEIAWHRDQLLEQLRAFRAEHENMMHGADTLKQQFRSLTDKHNLFFERIRGEKGESDLRVVEIQKQLVKREDKNKNLEQELQKQTTQVHTLEQLLCVKEDIASKLDQMNELTEELAQEKQKLQSDLEVTADYLIEQEDKTQEANKMSQQLLTTLKEKEEEVMQYQDQIVQLRKQMQVYVPMKDDAIDKKLAEFLNNFPDRSRLKVMFLRQNEGVYLFGTKRVFVKLEMDKIVIRVGGGYLTIEEFIDIYTPLELDRLERQDPLKRLTEKVAVSRVLVGRQISSPMRGGASPRKQQ